MASRRKLVRTLAQRRTASGYIGDFVVLFRSLAQAFFDNYRPELHYMRGPGPKWHAKHAPVRVTLEPNAMPALVRVRVR